MYFKLIFSMNSNVLGSSLLSEKVLHLHTFCFFPTLSPCIPESRGNDMNLPYLQSVFFSNCRCVENCNAKLNPSGRMALQGMCTGSSCYGALIFKWTVLKDFNDSSNSSQWYEISEIQEVISTRVSSKSLVTRPGVLTPGTRYKFILTAQRLRGYRGYSEYHVTSNSPPVGGVCNVSQTSGVALITEFTFTCDNWQDPDLLIPLQLQYEFIYFTDNLLNVAYKGVKSSLTTKLPSGEKKNNFTIDFRVRVTDMWGSFAEVRTPVQVRICISTEKSLHIYRLLSL